MNGLLDFACNCCNTCSQAAAAAFMDFLEKYEKCRGVWLRKSQYAKNYYFLYRKRSADAD